ncbi:hypothetical protein COLO4_23725 [Corchorus olitorius]|uniref:Uncharacterized protein n=1 Tax=Corchorus olitorius TaxID=93759 RepID=A0A1R3IF22_9ROSI|nr:hypothetical protein COLO4_23725 [Corchorus olitorius]
MGAQELNHGLQILQQNNIGSWEGFGGDDYEEADEETLSLCDLVMSSDANDYWNNHDESSNSSSSSTSNHHHDQDFFEFFSDQDVSASSASTYSGNNNNVIFCGKLIPFKDQKQPIDEEKPLKQENGNNQKKNNDVNSSSCMFPWKNMSQHSFNKSRTFPPSSSSSSSSKAKSLNKSLSLPVVGENKKLGDEKFDFSVKKVSILATPVKSRWYLFAFGVGRFPMEIELKDMKMRQSRKNKAIKVQQNAGSGEPENLKSNKEQRRSAKGLWRLLMVLGCKNKFTNSVL